MRLMVKEYIYILDTKAFDSLINDPVIEGRPIHAVGQVSYMMQFPKKYNRFSLAFYPLGDRNIWIFCLFMNNSDKLQRVQMERVNCSICNWTGIIANPTIPELYYACPNRWELLKEANEIPVVNCPVCSHILPRHSIWISD